MFASDCFCTVSYKFCFRRNRVIDSNGAFPYSMTHRNKATMILYRNLTGNKLMMTKQIYYKRLYKNSYLQALTHSLAHLGRKKMNV